MNRKEMVAVFTTELRKAYTRRERIRMIHGRWGEAFMTADGKIDGIIAAANAFGIMYGEIEGGNSK